MLGARPLGCMLFAAFLLGLLVWRFASPPATAAALLREEVARLQSGQRELQEVRAQLEARLEESEGVLISGKKEVAQQKEALDARIHEAATAAERAARLEPLQVCTSSFV